MTTATRRFHGRRHGRRLRPHRQRLLDDLLPTLRIAVPETPSLRPRALFQPATVRDVWLEVGFGAGEHMAWQAEQHRDVGIIGAEPFVNGVASLLRYVEERHLENVRILPNDVMPLVEALATGSIGRLFVLFPDPWPKRRHHARRIVRPETLDGFARILRDGAELRFATDDPGLTRWTLFHVLAHPAFEWPVTHAGEWRIRPADWPATRYEGKAVAAGRCPVFLRFKRRPRPR